jgi:TonB family protein
MYLDFEDRRPDVPRVPQVISRREGFLLALVLHLGLLVAYLLFPEAFTSPQPPQPEQVLTEADAPRFVYMEPLIERPAPPRPTAPLSDLDRRSTSPELAPVPTLKPRSQGNTPERVQGTPEVRAAGDPGRGQPTLESVRTAAPPDLSTAGTTTLSPPQPPTRPEATPGGKLGESLRNLQRYLQDQNFDNPQGGGDIQDPLIQFDSKGVEFGPWIRRFLAQVKRNWYVPRAAWLLHGRVSIRFKVYRDGRLTDIEIVRPSEVDVFNQPAANALRLSNPTLPLPEAYPEPFVEITVTFLYNEGRRP